MVFFAVREAQLRQPLSEESDHGKDQDILRNARFYLHNRRTVSGSYTFGGHGIMSSLVLL